MSSVRQPAVAGSFYDGAREALTASLRGCFLHDFGPGSLPQVDAEGPGAISAVVSPHAGYMFSGPAAAHGFAALAADGVPDIAVILGPSHHEADRAAAVSTATAWRTPLGDVEVDADFSRELTQSCPLIVADEAAHRREHSIEVQVPFLQFLYGDRAPKICPVCVRSHPTWSLDQLTSDVQAMGRAIAKALGARRGVVIASTDFSHQLPHAVAARQDQRALEAILALDPAALLQTVVEHGISMCGPAPVAIALSACLARVGRHEAELLRYYTSGDIIGDRTNVVGYASIVMRQVGGDHA